MSSERWLPVIGHPGYEVSDLGQVRSLDRQMAQLSSLGVSYSRVLRGQLLRPLVQKSGYQKVTVAGRTYRVHVLVMRAFVGPCPDGMEVCHWDGNKSNNQLENLRYDTRSENGRDAVRHGSNPSSAKTHCPRRHPLAMPNLVPSQARRGFRSCLACARARDYVENHPDVDLQSAADAKYAEIVNLAEVAR